MNATFFNRRQFVKSFATAAVYPTIGYGLGRFLTHELAAQSTGGNGFFQVDINATGFTALKADNGSIRVSVPGMAGTFPQIIVTRLAGNQFHAVTSKCTHQGCTVNTFNGSNLVCPCHNSVFTPAGVRVSGPASANLASYPATFDGSQYLKIQIPGLGYTCAGSLASAGGRLKIVFPTVSGSTYRVLAFTSAIGTKTATPFFTTQSGGSSVTSIAGTGSNLTIYVDPPTAVGFFVIAASK